MSLGLKHKYSTFGKSTVYKHNPIQLTMVRIKHFPFCSLSAHHPGQATKNGALLRSWPVNKADSQIKGYKLWFWVRDDQCIAMTGTHLLYKLVKLRSRVGLKSLPCIILHSELCYLGRDSLDSLDSLERWVAVRPDVSTDCPVRERPERAVAWNEKQICHVICKLSAARAFISRVAYVMISNTALDRSCPLFRTCKLVWRQVLFYFHPNQCCNPMLPPLLKLRRRLLGSSQSRWAQNAVSGGSLNTTTTIMSFRH